MTRKDDADEAEKSSESESLSSMFAKVAEGGSSQTAKEPDGKSLNEAAKEYEDSRKAEKRKYDEVETFTGEEDEVNIVDVSSLHRNFFLLGVICCGSIPSECIPLLIEGMCISYTFSWIGCLKLSKR